MKKALSTSSPDKGKKKRQCAPSLRDFGFVGTEEVDSKECQCKIEGLKKLEYCFCAGCNNQFKTDQGRGDHERACDLVQQHHKEKRKLDDESNNTIEASCTASTSFVYLTRKKYRDH